jgi:hypothetical protein
MKWWRGEQAKRQSGVRSGARHRSLAIVSAMTHSLTWLQGDRDMTEPVSNNKTIPANSPPVD